MKYYKLNVRKITLQSTSKRAGTTGVDIARLPFLLTVWSECTKAMHCKCIWRNPHRELESLYGHMTDEFICNYCGKVCKNNNSLRQHEIRCKMNPSKIVSYNPHNDPAFISGFKKGTRTWVHKNDKSILISIEKLSDYISDGWVKGISNVYKQKLKYQIGP